MAPESSENPGDSFLFWHITILNEKLLLHVPKWLHQLQQSLPHSSQQEGEKRKGAYPFSLAGHFAEIAYKLSIRIYHMSTCDKVKFPSILPCIYSNKHQGNRSNLRVSWTQLLSVLLKTYISFLVYVLSHLHCIQTPSLCQLPSIHLSLLCLWLLD